MKHRLMKLISTLVALELWVINVFYARCKNVCKTKAL